MSKATYDQVKSLLERYPGARDSDAQLMAYWLFENQRDPRLMTAQEFFQLADKRSIPSWAAMERARRKVQEHHPRLRGHSYQARQRKAQTSPWKRSMTST